MERAERISVISMERAPATAPAQIADQRRPDEGRDRRLARVHRQVSRGEYVVNSQNVAAAILERIGATFGEGRAGQREPRWS